MKKRPVFILPFLVLFICLTGCAPEHEYEITVESYPAHGGETVGSGAYTSGETLTIKAIPGDGYEFEKWERNGTEVSREEVLELTIVDDDTLTAVFVKRGVEMPDQVLEAAIRDELGIGEGPITEEALETLIFLDLSNKGIADLNGLSHAINLERLWLQGNELTELTELHQLTNLTELDLCLQSSNPFDIKELITNLPHLRRLDIAGMKRFNADADLRLFGSDDIFIEAESFIIDTLGQPEVVEMEERHVGSVVGIFEKKTYIYPELELILLRPYVHVPAAGEVFPDEDGQFVFSEARVTESGVAGPRGIEVGQSLEEVLSRFPVLYEDEEKTHQYSRVSVENGEVRKIEFSDYLPDSPYGFRPHHFTLTTYFQSDVIISYELKHILYAL